MPASEATIGHAKTVLVFGDNEQARAVVSSVVVRLCESDCQERVRFIGPVAFEESTARHISEMLLLIVDHLLEGLGLSRRNYEIAVVNLSAASVLDIGTRISGFSADVPVLLALLSASLQMPIPDDLLSTGHVASPTGVIRAVRAIPVKLAAAAADGSIRRFVYPLLDQDHSLEALSPAEYRRAADAITNAPETLQMIGVGDILELVKAVFDDEAIALASLSQEFFEARGPSDPSDGLLTQTLRFLTEQNAERFWTSVERHLLAGQSQDAQALLLARILYHIHRKAYPPGLGRELLQIVRSLPPSTRRLKLTLPLLPMDACIRLSQFATEADHEDVRHLFDAASGRRTPSLAVATDVAPPADQASGNPALETILSQIDAESLAVGIGLPIDAARASYTMDSVTVASYEEFNDAISAFYLHLRLRIHPGTTPLSSSVVSADAIALLERAFSVRGGLEAALAEAKEATHGGMRQVLDAMTEQLKTDEKAKHVTRVLREALDPLDWNAKVALMAAFLERLAAILPPELRSAPPERFARQWEMLVRVYVASLDQLKGVLRTL